MSECGDYIASAWPPLGSSNIPTGHSILRLNGMALEQNGNVCNGSGFNVEHKGVEISDVSLKARHKSAEQKHDTELPREIGTSDLITFCDSADIDSFLSRETDKDDTMRRTDDSARQTVTELCSPEEALGSLCSLGEADGISLYNDLHSLALKKSAAAAFHCLPDHLPNRNHEPITQHLTQDSSSNIEIKQSVLPEYFAARKGSDIRNNIPDMSNIRSCDRTLDNPLHCLQPKTNLMKMKKTSPGLAKRLVNTAEPEIATECGDVSAVELRLLLEENMENERDVGNKRSFNNDRSPGDSVTNCSSKKLFLKDLLSEHNDDDAVLASPLQEVDQVFYEAAANRGHSESGDGCSESAANDVFSYSYGLRDDTVVWSFTELSNDWSYVLTVSPDLSECSEIESSVSDDIDLSSCGEMPFVDDGLSVCDDGILPSVRQGTSTPTSEALQRESGVISVLDDDCDVVAKMNLSESDVADFFSSSFASDFAAPGEVDEEAACRKQRETFDLAMLDIKLAMEKSSRNICFVDQSINDCQSAEPQEEPVWVVRSNDSMIQTKLQQNDVNSRCDDKAEKRGAWPLEGDDNTEDEDGETDELLLRQHNDSKNANLSHSMESPSSLEKNQIHLKKASDGDAVLIEGLLFRTSYLGSTKLISDCNPTKVKRMKQAKEAVDCVKSPMGESQPRVEVDLFVSAEKIMVLDIVRQEVMMDYALQTISYIADIDDILILMVRQSLVVGSPADGVSDAAGQKRQVKICCHVFESDEAQLIAESIGRAFQVAYAEFLRANGINNPGLLSDINYEEVLNQQQIFGEELSRFSNKDMQQEVTISKSKGEPLGIVIVESGWGSMLPTAVVANLSLTGPAAKSNQINIGDQIMAINGVSLVGLPLSTCQNCIRAVRPDTIIRMTLVSCSPVVEVLIKRPDIKYQLGFSVQNGVICSLLRGGIGERGGVRVGHRIIEINGQSMVAVAHEKIIHSLATCVGELHMKTMQMTIFRLLTGEDIPHFI